MSGYNFLKVCFFSLKILFYHKTHKKSVDADEMPLYAAFQLRLHCLQKYPFRGFQYTKG